MLGPCFYPNTNAISHGSLQSSWWWILTWGPPALAGHNQNLGVGKEWYISLVHINDTYIPMVHINGTYISKPNTYQNPGKAGPPTAHPFKFFCTHSNSLPARTLCIYGFSFRTLQLRTLLQIQHAQILLQIHTQSQIHSFHPISSFFFHPLYLAASLHSQVIWTIFSFFPPLATFHQLPRPLQEVVFKSMPCVHPCRCCLSSEKHHLSCRRCSRPLTAPLAPSHPHSNHLTLCCHIDLSKTDFSYFFVFGHTTWHVGS